MWHNQGPGSRNWETLLWILLPLSGEWHPSCAGCATDAGSDPVLGLTSCLRLNSWNKPTSLASKTDWVKLFASSFQVGSKVVLFIWTSSVLLVTVSEYPWRHHGSISTQGRFVASVVEHQMHWFHLPRSLVLSVKRGCSFNNAPFFCGAWWDDQAHKHLGQPSFRQAQMCWSS